MMIVNNDEFEKEIKDSKVQEQVISGQIENIPVKGRKTGDNNVPESLRKIIGNESEINGRESARRIAQEFGVSDSSISAYANGSRSTTTYDKRPNLPFLNKQKNHITKRAQRKILNALEHITEDKLEDAKPTELAMIAKALSGVVRDMEPEKESTVNNNNAPQFIVMAPVFKKEEHYDMMFIKE
jgi:hypothetical protein